MYQDRTEYNSGCGGAPGTHTVGGMKETDAPLGNELPALPSDDDGRSLTWADWIWRAFLALLVVVFGGLVTTLVPLLAIAVRVLPEVLSQVQINVLSSQATSVSRSMAASRFFSR